jgi:ribosome-associated protein
MGAGCTVDPAQVDFSAIRAQGAGGPNVNKVSNAVHLRYDLHAASLPDEVKARLLAQRDQRISADGVVVIKAQTHRSLERNRADALARLQALVDAAASVPRARRPTAPTRGSVKRRLQRKALHARQKAARGRVDPHDG